MTDYDHRNTPATHSGPTGYAGQLGHAAHLAPAGPTGPSANSTPRSAARPAAGQPASQGAMNIRWLLGDFLGTVAGVEEAVVVSSDGLLLADSQHGVRSDQLSAIVSALTSLAQGLARAIEFGGVRQTIVTMDEGHLVVMAISDGSCLGVFASLNCDLGVLAYQMALLVERAGHALTPQVRSELHRAMAVR